MGIYVQTIVAPDVDAIEAEAIGVRVLGWFKDCRIVSEEPIVSADANSVAYSPGVDYSQVLSDPNELAWEEANVRVVTGRTVFHSGPGLTTVSCPGCGACVPSEKEWLTAVDEWFADDSRGELRCRQCAVVSSIATWRFEPHWGFGYLGFEFVNWPLLSAMFVNRLAQEISGRVLRVEARY